jgi:hypothetical protein
MRQLVHGVVHFVPNVDTFRFEITCLECGGMTVAALSDQSSIAALEHDAFQKRGGLCLPCFAEFMIPFITRREVRMSVDIRSALTPKPSRRETGLPGFDQVEAEEFDDSSFTTHADSEYPEQHRPPLDFVGPQWAILRISARELVMKVSGVRMPRPDIEQFIARRIAEHKMSQDATFAFANKSGLTIIWVWDESGNLKPWNDIDPFGFRLSIQLNGNTKWLSNLGKRVTALTRSFPIRRILNAPIYVEVKWVRDAQNNVVGAEPLTPFTRVPGRTIIGIGPEADENGPAIKDGAFICNRDLLAGGIFELDVRMRTDEKGFVWDRHQAATLNDTALRLRVEKMLDDAERTVKHLQSINVWNVRLFGPMVSEEAGGHFKGDQISTRPGFVIPDGFDIITSTHNLKAEAWCTTGNLIFLADDAHSGGARIERWTDRQTLIHHWDWLLKDNIGKAIRVAHRDVVESLMANREPKYLKFASIDLAQVFNPDSGLAIFGRRHDIMRKGGVFNMSTSAVEGVIKARWEGKLAPKERTNAKGEVRTLEDTRKFPVAASQYDGIKPAGQAKMAGYMELYHVVKDGYWESTPMGVVTNDVTFAWVMQILGGGDQDDHVAMIHVRSAFDCSIPLWNGATIDVKAGEIVTVFLRLPIGVSSGKDANGNPALATEYVILKPTEVEVDLIEDAFPAIPTIDLSTRPIRKDELTYPCNDQHTFVTDPVNAAVRCSACGAWSPREVNWSASSPNGEYTWQVFIAQAYTLAKIQAMGGVGARANVEMVAYQHGFAFPHRCHTETWVDLFTKSICHPADVDDWVKFNSEDFDLFFQLSQFRPIDEISNSRVWMNFLPRRPKTERRMFRTLSNDHIASIEEMRNMVRGRKLKDGITFDPAQPGVIRGIKLGMRIALSKLAPLTSGPGCDVIPRGDTHLYKGGASKPMLPVLLERINRHIDAYKAQLILADTWDTQHEPKRPTFGIEQDGKTWRTEPKQLSAKDWDQIGDDIVYILKVMNGLTNADIIALILKSLQWIYCGQGPNVTHLDDKWLVNGALLELTVEALKLVRDKLGYVPPTVV